MRATSKSASYTTTQTETEGLFSCNLKRPVGSVADAVVGRLEELKKTLDSQQLELYELWKKEVLSLPNPFPEDLQERKGLALCFVPLFTHILKGQKKEDVLELLRLIIFEEADQFLEEATEGLEEDIEDYQRNIGEAFQRAVNQQRESENKFIEAVEACTLRKKQMDAELERILQMQSADQAALDQLFSSASDAIASLQTLASGSSENERLFRDTLDKVRRVAESALNYQKL